jgi:hypothetical protein
VKKIQKAFRCYKSRKILKIWQKIYEKLIKTRKNKENLKISLRILSSRLKLQACLDFRNRKKMLQRLKEVHSINVIKRFWERQKLSYEKVLRKIKRFKSKNSKVTDEKSRTFTQDSTSPKANDEASLTRRSSLKKKNHLPPLPMTPKTLNQKAMLFLLKPKKIHSRLTKAVRPSHHSEGPSALPKILIH